MFFFLKFMWLELIFKIFMLGIRSFVEIEISEGVFRLLLFLEGINVVFLVFLIFFENRLLKEWD